MDSNTIQAIIYKNIIHMSRYKFDLLFWAILPVFWVLPLIFQGLAFVGGFKSDSFQQLTGTKDYLTFLVLGTTLFMFVSSTLWGSANAIRWEQESGTLEALWSTPTSRIDILIGTSISETIWSSINILIQLTFISILLRLKFDPIGAFISIGVVILTVFGLYGFGILFAGIVLVFKEPGTLTDLVETGFSILTPVRYSLQALPSYARYISLLIPFTLGLSVIRKLMVPNIVLFPYLETFYFVLGLIGLDALLWVCGYLLFTKMEAHTREKGTLGAY